MRSTLIVLLYKHMYLLSIVTHILQNKTHFLTKRVVTITPLCNSLCSVASIEAI